ncbi:MAG: DEAD/DEAH box helicase [Candidatus Krumholzibacteria bacterium]|nr:DEAD/DEAH box helicase [Candidatus Krumholzibacteria bacterium]
MQTHDFTHFKLSKLILRALAEQGYTEPTDIQRAAIPEVLAGKDLMATAQTGTGKTAAFSLPMLHMLSGRSRGRSTHIRALILTPTRELALQIDQSLRDYGRHLPLRSTVVLGGVSSVSQIKALRKNPDILVATPGRLIDLVGQGHVRLNQVEMLVLDEADRMLDMGFVRDVRRIVAKTPRSRQTMLFSATLTGAIAGLASDMLQDPTHVAVDPASSVSGNIAQKVLFVEQSHKLKLLASVLNNKDVGRTLVFTRTKHGAERVMRWLAAKGISADSIHSNKNQKERQHALTSFDKGRVRVLVATDIVARGIDVDGISHVVNYELPNDPESYVHRIGRTARAGADGTALSFCAFQEVAMLKAIEKLTKCSLTLVDDHPYHSPTIGTLGAGKSALRSSSRRRLGPRRRSGRRSR